MPMFQCVKWSFFAIFILQRVCLFGTFIATNMNGRCILATFCTEQTHKHQVLIVFVDLYLCFASVATVMKGVLSLSLFLSFYFRNAVNKCYPKISGVAKTLWKHHIFSAGNSPELKYLCRKVENKSRIRRLVCWLTVDIVYFALFVPATAIPCGTLETGTLQPDLSDCNEHPSKCENDNAFPALPAYSHTNAHTHAHRHRDIQSFHSRKSGTIGYVCSNTKNSMETHKIWNGSEFCSPCLRNSKKITFIAPATHGGLYKLKWIKNGIGACFACGC